MHADGAISLAGWEGMLVCGSGHGTIGVWELETGALAATLAGHSDFVCGLLVRGARLFSASSIACSVSRGLCVRTITRLAGSTPASTKPGP